MKTIIRSISFTSIFRLFLIAIVLIFCTSCFYMKMNPPPDVDKGPPVPTVPCNPGEAIVDNSCYMATASNMLAGAGYGTGTTVRDRAEEIYDEMVAQYGKECSGWTDTALSWWLSSANNTWSSNPYTVVTVYGNKNPRYPWANTNGARFIGNELRRCQFLGLSISWPTTGASIGSGGHAITGWGDNLGKDTLSINPTKVRLADSDNDIGGDVQAYTYDSYTNPNPGGANEGNGWYLDYDPNHPYIKHIVTLCSTDDPSDNKLTQKVIGSYKIHQANKSNATDLHYEVSTDVTILSYKTTIDWSTENAPSITESEPRRHITVNWDLTDKPVPYCTWVTITTEFVLPTWNAMEYKDVHFTYPVNIKPIPFASLAWEMRTPRIEKPETIRNVSGGYVVGSFDIINTQLPLDQRNVAEYRFIHEYSFNQSPEMHDFHLTGTTGYTATNFRFGHVYGYLNTKSLWSFEDWMTKIPDREYPLGDKRIDISINWEGRLPYPEGEDIRGRIRKKEQPTDCVDFEQQVLDTVYHVGDIFTESGVEINIQSFGWGSDQLTTGYAKIENRQLAGHTGQDIFVGNVNLSFNFGGPRESLSLRFGEYGGYLNININGDLRSFQNFADINGATIGGVTISVISVVNGFGNERGILQLSGTINSFAIGGQELCIDHVCT